MAVKILQAEYDNSMTYFQDITRSSY